MKPTERRANRRITNDLLQPSLANFFAILTERQQTDLATYMAVADDDRDRRLGWLANGSPTCSAAISYRPGKAGRWSFPSPKKDHLPAHSPASSLQEM